jgi:hypothetical protein
MLSSISKKRVAENDDKRITKTHRTDPIIDFIMMNTDRNERITTGSMQYPRTEIVLYSMIESF